jgi:hypothetical protein
MANISRWIINTAFTTVTFTAGDLNSLASGGAAVATAAITNGTALDLYADVSMIITVGGTTTATSFLSLYLLPLQQDGTTYGDGAVSSTTVQPVATYLERSAWVKVGVASGSTVSAMFRGVVLPPGDFKLALANNLGVALSSTAALTMKYRSYNENLNA